MIKGMPQLIKRIDAVASSKVPHATLVQWQVRAVALAKMLALPHKKTGNLSRSIHAGSISSSRASIEASANYAAYLEFGTKAHVIVPVRAKALAWGGSRRLTGSLRSGSSPTVFAMRVEHPGNPPYPFLRPAAERALGELGIEAVVSVWNGAA